MAKKLVQRFNAVFGKSYENSKGEEKTQWVKLGRAAQFDDGSIVVNVDCLPTGEWNGQMNLFPEQEQQQPQQGYQQPQQGYQQPQQYGGYQQPQQGYQTAPQQAPQPQVDNLPF